MSYISSDGDIWPDEETYKEFQANVKKWLESSQTGQAREKYRKHLNKVIDTYKK